MSSLAFAASLGRLLRSFARSRRGSTAVEFAMVAPLFFALLFAIIETALVFFAGQALETAAQDSARLIRTGQAQSGSFTPEQFKANVCARVAVLFACTNGIYVDVQSYPSFSSVAIVDPINPATKCFVDNMKYVPGNAGDIVVVRVFYQWPLFVTGLGYNVSNLCNSKRLLSATAAFRNEPYS